MQSEHNGAQRAHDESLNTGSTQLAVSALVRLAVSLDAERDVLLDALYAMRRLTWYPALIDVRERAI
jgi:hypothetical protein